MRQRKYDVVVTKPSLTTNFSDQPDTVWTTTSQARYPA